MDQVWRLTQEPDFHQRWDLRFTRIKYLPKVDGEDPQRFLYETRIGFGLVIRGTGESVATRLSPDGTATSSLKFASDDKLSLISEGAGYWRYVPTSEGLRFLTWYDYRTRHGLVGRIVDAAFRPLMGWATAWSFDRLRIWAEDGTTPETSLQMSIIHALCRISLAGVWVWHGFVPKLLFRDVDEQIMLAQAGVAARWLPWVGVGEVVLGMLVFGLWRWRGMFLLQAALMLAALCAVVMKSPAYLSHAFNPVTLNLLVVVLAVVGWIASSNLPSATRCLRKAPLKVSDKRQEPA
jgi:uncharacterized membrane protein YphA (DoxX/SURF4 family)